MLMDIKSWLLPHTEELHNHSNPHIFLFYRNRDGHAEIKYERWTNDNWEPRSENPGLKLIKVLNVCNDSVTILFKYMYMIIIVKFGWCS